MAVTSEEEEGEVNGKLVKQRWEYYHHIGELLRDMGDAELASDLRKAFVTRPFDYLETIARNRTHSNEKRLGKLLELWRDCDTKFGSVDVKMSMLEVGEFRARKQAVIKLLDDLGMMSSEPGKDRDLSPPLRLAEYHRRCQVPENLKQLLEEDETEVLFKDKESLDAFKKRARQLLGPSCKEKKELLEEHRRWQ